MPLTPVFKSHQISVNIHIFFLSFFVFMQHSRFIFNSVDLILLCWYGFSKHAKCIVYVPAIRLFQRHKTINANTVTASNGPTMKYHCTVVLAAKKKQTNKHTNKKKHEGPKANQIRSLLKFICYPRLIPLNGLIGLLMLHVAILFVILFVCFLLLFFVLNFFGFVFPVFAQKCKVISERVLGPMRGISP